MKHPTVSTAAFFIVRNLKLKGHKLAEESALKFEIAAHRDALIPFYFTLPLVGGGTSSTLVDATPLGYELKGTTISQGAK